MSDLAKQPLAYFLQEQRATNLKQNDLIVAQQQLIDLLAQLLTENGLGEILDSNGISKLVGKAKAPGLSSVLRTFGPTSAPIIWSGGLKDPIPVETNGIVTTAQIMTDQEAELWNRILDLNTRIRKYKSQIEIEEYERESYRESLQRFIDGLTTDPEEEELLRVWIKESEERCLFLEGKVCSCEAEVKSSNRKLGRRALQFLLKSNLRRKEDPKPWVEEIFQNLQKDFDNGVPRFDRELEDERTVDLNDTEDESTVPP